MKTIALLLLCSITSANCENQLKTSTKSIYEILKDYGASDNIQNLVKQALNEKDLIIAKKDNIIKEAERAEFFCATSRMRCLANSLYNVQVRTFQEDYFILGDEHRHIFHAILHRICPQDKIDRALEYAKEYGDYFQSGSDDYAKCVREFIPNHSDRLKCAALLPAMFYKMSIYLCDDGGTVSEANLQYRKNESLTLADALLAYDGWNFKTEDFDLLNLLLKCGDTNEQFKLKIIDKNKDIVLPTLSVMHC